MDDLISRQAAINTVLNIRQKCDTNDIDEYRDILVECFEELPTAEKKGKWEIDVDCEYDIFDIAGERTWAVKATCSECGFVMRFIEGHGVFNYCPNCGARMEE